MSIALQFWKKYTKAIHSTELFSWNSSYMEISENGGTPKSSIDRWIFPYKHYKPSIWGYLHLWKPPYMSRYFSLGDLWSADHWHLSSIMFLVDGPKKIMRTLMPKSWTQGGHIPPSRSFGSSIASFSQQVLSRSGARPVVRVTFLISGTAISIIYWLVVWNMTFIFHNIWDVILPIDELHHFQDGQIAPPTSLLVYICIHDIQWAFLICVAWKTRCKRVVSQSFAENDHGVSPPRDAKKNISAASDWLDMTSGAEELRIMGFPTTCNRKLSWSIHK